MGSQPVILNGEGAPIAERFWACVTAATLVLCDKLYPTRPPSPYCDCCKRAIVDDPTHAMMLCTSNTMSRIRNEHLPPLLQLLSTEPGWCVRYRAASTRHRAAQLLQSPNISAEADRRSEVPAIRHKWLSDIRRNHPTYKIFLKGKGVKAASVAHKRSRT